MNFKNIYKDLKESLFAKKKKQKNTKKKLKKKFQKMIEIMKDQRNTMSFLDKNFNFSIFIVNAL